MLRSIVVLTEFKEVLWGKTEDPQAIPIVMKDVKMAVYFSRPSKGLVGLASIGPSEGSRITPMVDELHVYKPAVVLLSSQEADREWEKDQWA